MKGAKPKQGAIRRGVSDSYSIVKDEERAGVVMPEDIAKDPVRSQIWAWIAPPVNSFTEQDLPNLRLLCYWHAVAAQAQQCLASPKGDGSVEIFDQIGVKDFLSSDEQLVPLMRKNPAIQVLKDASAEIRALSDQLGLSPLARSRIGLLNATTVKTAADTAAMFRSIDAAYGDLPETIEIEADQD